MKRFTLPILFAALTANLLLVSCKDNSGKTDTSNQTEEKMITVEDPHSYAKPGEVQATHLDLDVKVNFDEKKITGTAGYVLDKRDPNATEVHFDAHGLDIQEVKIGKGEGTPTEFSLGENDPLLGQDLTVQLTPEAEYVQIQYATSPEAEALQWLNPVQTAGKKHPFLFTQSQAILARTWIPCQDGPGMRFTYHAKVEVPKDLLAVMSASNPQEKNAEGIYEFDMVQPIPAYLMAMAVGDLQFDQMGARTGIYAEPSVIESATYEFAETEQMLEAAEALYGDYRWDRYDLLVLPPSFPFGGMENPRLTFVTPTVIAGDRSLTSLIAHELAHSWSGNLVTNANWNDFWLNEGFTVYFERRIMESLYGESYSDMLRQLGYQDLMAGFEELPPEDEHLKLDLSGRSPDDGLTDVAYEKGSFFLTHIENTVGREKFDAFLKGYFDSHAFQVMTTEGFVDYLKAELVKGDTALEKQLLIDEWIYQPGMPDVFKPKPSERFEQVDLALTFLYDGEKPENLKTDEWSSHEWLHFIRHLPEDTDAKKMADLDATFDFTHSGNAEIQAAWFMHSIKHDYEPASGELEAFLIRVGRRKFLKPLYSALAETESGKARAKEIYAKARPNYHAVSVGTIDDILDWE